MVSQVYNWVERLWCNFLVVWLDGYILRPGSNLWLDVKDLQLYRIIGLKYMKKISNIR